MYYIYNNENNTITIILEIADEKYRTVWTKGTGKIIDPPWIKIEDRDRRVFDMYCEEIADQEAFLYLL